jgi:uncharacterized membrane protein
MGRSYKTPAIAAKTLTAPQWISKNPLKGVLILTLVLGIFFRFVNLGHQVYWHDEAYTSLRLSGYSAIEVNKMLFDGEVIDREAFQTYQQPNAQKSIADTVNSLAIDDSQHPPIYYVLLRIWTQTFGTGIATIRSLSALFSLILFPAIYWLCQELFLQMIPQRQDSTAKPLGEAFSWLAIALVAVSPFHLLYAQEAREYALWGGLIALWTAAFLRAIRRQTWSNWGLATVFLVLCLYTQPVTLLLMVGYGAYLLIVQRFRITKTIVMGGLSLALGLLAFSPWLHIIAQSWSRTGANWTAVPLPLDILLKTWALHLERFFIIPEGDFGFDTGLVYLTLLPLLALSGYAFYLLCRQTSIRVWLMVLVLTGIVFAILGLPDLIIGGQRSTSSRYLVPFYLGIPIAIAYLLSSKLFSSNALQRNLSKGAIATVLSLQVLFCTLNTQTETVWTKGINYNIPTVANILNSKPRPLLVSHSFGINFGSLFALSYRTDPKVKYQIVDGWFKPDYENVPTLPSGFSDTYILNPSDRFRQALEKQSGQPSELVFKDSHLFLWHLEPKP